MDNLSTMLGGNGTYFIDSGAAVTGKDYSILVVNSDAVLTTLTGVGSPAPNGLTILNLTGKTLKQGSVIRLPGGRLISAVTVASGSVWGVSSGEPTT